MFRLCRLARAIRLPPFLLLLPAALRAQTATDANEGLRLEPAAEGGSGPLQLSWFGRAGRIYFIEHSSDLYVWQALPAFEAGADTIAHYGFVPPDPAGRLFVRVRWVSATLAEFQNQDYDQDGLLNAAEATAGLNPFARDTDEDGLPDGYEIAYGLNPLTADAGGDLDFDGVPNREDARPADAAIGRLSVSVVFPTEGGAL